MQSQMPLCILSLIACLLRENSADDLTGDKGDIKRVAKQCMHQSASKRMISKQEACLLLAELELTVCSETIENVSISKTKALRMGEGKGSNDKFINKYAKRPKHLEKHSLYEYFIYSKNSTVKTGKAKYIIPNFVGMSGRPQFPVSNDYARHELIVHRPWRVYPTSSHWTTEFAAFLNSQDCPVACRMPYERVMRRHYDNMTHYQPVSKRGDHTANEVASEDAELLDLVGLKHTAEYDHELAILTNIDRGHDHKWDSEPNVSFCWDARSHVE